MKKLHPPGLALFALLAFLAFNASAVISVGPGGTGLLTFTASPSVSSWSTLNWGGLPSDILDAAGMDAYLVGETAAMINTALPTSTVNPPGANAVARWNTTLNLLQTRPNTSVRAVLLMARLWNTTLSNTTTLTIQFDRGRQNWTAPEAQVDGWRVYYSMTGNGVDWVNIPALNGSTPGTASATVSAAWPNNTPAYVLWVDDSGSEATSPSYTMTNVSFTASGGTPALVAVSQPPSVRGLFTATMNGTVNPQGTGLDANVWFEYGTDTFYGFGSVAATPATVGGATVTATSVSAAISGLTPGTVYHYRVVASNSTGETAYGADQTFVTYNWITTESTTGISLSGTTATLNGTVDPNGTATTAWFDWGTTTGYGNSTTPVTNPGLGFVPVAYSAGITGLTPNTVYHYRAAAMINGVANYGPDVAFIAGRTIPQDSHLFFSAVTEDLPASGNISSWPAFAPQAAPLVTIRGTPTVQNFGGRKWDQNYRATSSTMELQDPALAGNSPAYAYQNPVGIDGATIVLAARPIRTAGGDPWMSIVDIFYGQLCLGIRNDNGLVCVKVSDTANNNNTATAPAGTAIPEGQATIISMVVANTGRFVVYTNGIPIWTNTPTLGAGLGYTQLTPGANGGFARFICLGGNQPDGWPIYNGYIGDFFVYTNVLSDVDRQALEADLTYKFITTATNGFTITASAGPNGSISPSGAVSVVQGYSRTFNITANPGYVVNDVLVDGLSVGAANSYTFTNVAAAHTISVNFASLPPQNIVSSVTGSGGTISPLGTTSVPAGNNQTYTMLPSPGFAVANVVVDGVPQGERYSYTFNFVVAPHTISVSFRTLDMNVPQVGSLIFAAEANVLPGDSSPITNWPVMVPLGTNLTVQGGAPTSVIGIAGTPYVSPELNTNIWESNVRATFDGLRYSGGPGGVVAGDGGYTAPIACSGATIIAVAAPNVDAVTGDAWTSLVDVFYNELTLGIRHDTGAVYARVHGTGVLTTHLIPSLQPTVLSMVVQPSGSCQVWANGFLILSNNFSALTSLQPGIAGNFADYINVGRNNPDPWPAFNGNIGDIFLYKTALSDADRLQLEGILMTKYSAPLPPSAPVLSGSDFSIIDGVPTVQIQNTAVGFQYTLVYKLNLTDATWTALTGAGTGPGTGGAMTLSDPTAPPLAAQRFYSIRME